MTKVESRRVEEMVDKEGCGEYLHAPHMFNDENQNMHVKKKIEIFGT